MSNDLTFTNITKPDGSPLTGRQLESFQKFSARLAALGATLLESHWLGSAAKHRIRCANGHECSPKPNSVNNGRGVCLICSGKDPATAEQNFRDAMAKLGGVVLGSYVNNKIKVLTRCANGHECFPTPHNVNKGNGICRACVDRDPVLAEQKFRAAVAKLGGTVIGSYVDNGTKVHIQCANGHECFPIPNSVSRGQGICLVCAGKDPTTAERKFRDAVTKLGGTVLGPYVNNATKVHVRCANGHDCFPKPHSVNSGSGICRYCSGMTWDIFYLVHNQKTRTLKFGITSGDPRGRLSVHARNGFTEIIRLHEKLEGNTAHDLELSLKRHIPAVGIPPIDGHLEYFPDSAMGAVLDMVDEWLQ